MSFDDTIAAISTSIGRSGIGIVRLSGADAIKIADSIFLSPRKKSLKKIPSHRIIYGHIRDSKEIIDEVLISVMRAPRTCTREDIAEINCHGGPVPLRRILELVIKKGARLAEPGEFTRRAFLNGRIDLAQAEAVLDVINSMTEQSRKAAMEQMQGGFSKKIAGLREQLIELTALVESYIDFPEEDLKPPSLKKMRQTASDIRNSLKHLIDDSRYGVILREGLRTAIIGSPNVGKSSLLNALLDEDRAIVTRTPGTTRDVIEDYLNINGIPVKIMDTAGIRKVKDMAEKEGVRRSISAMKNADLVLIVLDGSKNLHETDMELIRKSDPGNTILVINKTDLSRKMRLKAPGWKTVRISAKKRTGLDRLKEAIIKTALKGRALDHPGFVTNIRHVDAMKKSLSPMENFLSGIDKKLSHEFLAVELREALDSTGEILGITTPEDILNKIFSNFCIGK